MPIQYSSGPYMVKAILFSCTRKQRLNIDKLAYIWYNAYI